MSCQQCHRFLCSCNPTYGPLPKPTRPAPPMPEIKQPIPERRTLEPEKIKPPIGLRPKYIAYSERLKEIHAAMGRYLDAGKVIPQEWVEEFDKLNREML